MASTALRGLYGLAPPLFATELAPLARDDWGRPVGARDTRVARLAWVVLVPGLLSRDCG